MCGNRMTDIRHVYHPQIDANWKQQHIQSKLKLVNHHTQKGKKLQLCCSWFGLCHPSSTRETRDHAYGFGKILTRFDNILTICSLEKPFICLHFDIIWQYLDNISAMCCLVHFVWNSLFWLNSFIITTVLVFILHKSIIILKSF